MNLLWATSLLFSLFLIGSSARIPLDTKYVITAPKVFSPKDSKVCLVPLHGTFSISSEKRWVEVALQDLVSGNVLIQKREPLSVDDVTCVDLPLTNIRHSSAELKVQVPDVLTEVRTVQVSPLSIGMTLIETSKPVYRPGDLVKLRIINFDGRMKLYETVLKKLSVYNPRGLIAMEWRDVKVESGMKLFKFPLAYNNIEGPWKIVAVTYDNQVIEKPFQVDLKVPQVLIDLKSEPYIFANEQQQRVVMCAKNKYGAPVRGEFQIVAYQSPHQHLETIGGETDEYGCLHVTLHDSKLGWSQRVGGLYTVKATFTSENPNYLVSITKQLFVVSSPIFLRKPSHKFVANYFKPNLPYFGYLIASRPNAEPVVGQDVQICYEPRTKPWISYTTGRQCHTLRSGLNGVVKFVIPPVDEDVKQLYIEANLPGISGHKQVFVVNPWTSTGRNHFVIEPRVIDNCEDEQNKFQIIGNLDAADAENVFWTRSTGSAKQGISKKRLSKSQLSQYLVQDPKSVWPYTIGEWPSSNQIYRLPIDFDVQDDPEWHLERLVVFAADSQGNLMSDSSSWIRNCVPRDTPFELTRKDKELEIKLKSGKSAPCAFSVDSDDKRGKLTERKITKMLEHYDSSYDPLVLDKCASEKTQRGPYVPYDVSPMTYHNDWDVFTRGGLIPFSNYPIYDKPCGWESIPEELYNQTYLGYLEGRRYMPYDDHVMDYEESHRDWNRIYADEYHLDEPVEWNLIPSAASSMKVSPQQQKRFVPRKDLHLNAICNDEKGMRIYNIKQRSSDVPFDVYFHVDEVVHHQAITPFHIVIRRSAEDVEKSRCVPVSLEIKNTRFYKVVDYERKFCACGEYYQVNGHFLPLMKGSTYFEVTLKYDESLSSCESTSDARFSRYTEKFPLDIEYGLRSGYEHLLKEIDIQCEKDQRVFKNYTENKFAVSSDLISVLAWKNKISLPMKKHIMHVLSNYLPLVQLYKHNKDKLPYELNEQIKNQLSLTAQELYFYRLTDGSYKMTQTSRTPDFPATLTAYITLTKARELGYQHDERDISQTYQWLASTLDSEGCVSIPREWYRNWTRASEEKQIKTELTAFLISILYQTQNHEFITRKAIRCIPESVEDRDNDILNAMVANIWAWKHKTERAQKFLDAIKLETYTNQRSRLNAIMFEPEHVSLQTKRNVLSFYLLAALHDQKLYVQKPYAIALRELAVNDETLEQPINLYSVAKAWLKVQKSVNTPEVKISGKSLKLKPYEWKLLENYPQESKVEVHKGCAVFYRTAPISTRSLQDAKVEIKNLGVGYKNCGSRMVEICHSLENMYEKSHRTYVFKYPHRYYLEEETMKKMTEFRQNGVELYSKIPGGLMVVPKYGSRCVSIPIVQRYSYDEPAKGFVQIYEGSDSYAEPVEIEYEIPVECDVKNYDYAPVSYEIVQCPFSDDSSCPYCMNGDSSSCDSAESYIGLPMKLTRRSSKWIPRSVEEIPSEKQCYKFQLQVAKVNEKAEEGVQKTFYLRKECACTPPSPRGYILTSRLTSGKEEHQLTSGDLVSFSANVHGRCSRKIRGRRDTSAATSTSNTAARASTAESSAATSAKADRAYEAKGSYPAPQTYEQPPEAKGYKAPPPAYEPPSYEQQTYVDQPYTPPAYQAPAYQPPAYQPPAYQPPAYQAPAYPAPAYQPPAYQPPVYQAPAYMPTYQAPSYPSYEPQGYVMTYEPSYPAPPPSYEAPKGYQAPPYEPYQSPSYEPQTYPSPHYQAPAYPSYPAPSYPAPSYPAPSYPAPSYPTPSYPTYEQPSYMSYPAPSYPAPSYPAPSYPSYPTPSYEAPSYPAPSYPAPSYPAPSYPSYPTPSYPSYPTPSYPAPSYPAPSYPSYPTPSYTAPSYPAPSYPAPSYPSYEPSYMSYPTPSYPAPSYPSYPTPSYPAPSYPAPSYPSYPTPSYEAPSYPSYPAPSYPAPSYPSYPTPSYPAPSYPAPSYPAPSYPAPSYPSYPTPSYPAPSYPAPSYPAYSPPAYAPSYPAPSYPTYSPPSYPAPAYEAAPYVAPSYEPYRNAGNSMKSHVARKQQTAGRRQQAVSGIARSRHYLRNVHGMAFRSASNMQASPSELFNMWARPQQLQDKQCLVTSYEDSCPRCYESVSLDVMDKLCTAQKIFIAQPYENFGIGESPFRCGNYTVEPLVQEKTLQYETVPFTMKKQCSCQPLVSGPVVVLDDIESTPVDVEGHKFADKTMIVSATELNIRAIRDLVSSCSSA